MTSRYTQPLAMQSETPFPVRTNLEVEVTPTECHTLALRLPMKLHVPNRRIQIAFGFDRYPGRFDGVVQIPLPSRHK
jgi:hypothetical protein